MFLVFSEGWPSLVESNAPAEEALPVAVEERAALRAALDDPAQRIVADAGSPSGYRVDAVAVPVTGADVDAEADRRVALGLQFGGRLFQFGASSRENIMGASALAGMAISIDGAEAGDFLWHGGDQPFVFLDAANDRVLMDAPIARGFGQAGARWQSLHIFAARALKDGAYGGSIPADYEADVYWPDLAGSDPLAGVELPLVDDLP